MLVIFDCDGVLVDSEPLGNAALRASLAEVGVVLTLEETMAEFMGRDGRHLQTRATELLGAPLPEGFMASYRARRDAAMRAELRAVPGIEQALDAIEHPTCVASSSSHRGLRLSLGVTGLYERFEGRIFSAEDVARGKPAPDLFLHAASSMGFAPADCVVIEDSAPGVAAGRAARMRVLHYGQEFLSMDQLPGLL